MDRRNWPDAPGMNQRATSPVNAGPPADGRSKGLAFVPDAGAKGRGEMRRLDATMQRPPFLS
jgi:hypothetical protein